MFLSKSRFLVSVFCAVLFLEFSVSAQNNVCSSSTQRATAGKSDQVEYPAEHYLLRNILCDQANIWTSPLRLRLRDMKFLVPFAGIATGLIVTDRSSSFEMTRGSHVSTSQHISDAGVVLAGVAVVGSYGLGRFHADDHLRETGVLAGEAALDSVVIDEIFKFGFRRDRPFEGDKKGHFFRSGQSFPSEHAGVTWAVAAVMANEYPGWFTKTLAYGTASAVSLARVSGQQHYLSDVFVSGALGYVTGKYVYKAHHDTDLGGEDYGTFVHDENPLSPGNMGSASVPLDSWIYPAVERLAALGAIHSDFLGLRPWTRMSIAGMLSEAEDQLSDDESQNPEIQNLYGALKTEFSDELRLQQQGTNQSIRLESLYKRSMYIAGRPLNDGYHFGQTIINDFGRPYQQGYNQVSGFSARAEDGRFSFYVRGEYQHAPALPGYSAQVNQVLSQIDGIPGETFTGEPQHNQFHLLDTYASINVLGNDISVGKQTYWWAPDDSTALMLSNNAAPFYGLRINRVLPLYIPLFSRLFGPIRYDNFFGRLYGNRFPPDPFTFGQKLSLHPTQNLELGFSRSSIFAGKGLEPLTFGTFKKSFTSLTSGTNVGFNPRFTPGTRHGGFDFNYRLPYLRNWVSLYADSFVHDDVSPLDAPRRAAVTPGIYISHFPHLAKLDLHVEGGTTDTVTRRALGGSFYYYETLYKDSYTINRNLLGSWIGREGTGGQAWATYWVSPTNSLMVGYRTLKVSRFFIPQGETLSDYSAKTSFRVHRDMEVGAYIQYERWNAPFLADHPVSNFTSAFQVTFWPKDIVKRATEAGH